MPVAYILENKEFMGLDFKVTPSVLIPRPDTEILVEVALKRLTRVVSPRILDIGTGSGAICVSMLVKMQSALGVAVDISPTALAVASDNATRHNVLERLTFCQGDLFNPVQVAQVFDAILSNPPYIPEADIAGLAPEVRQEPLQALVGGADGLDFYRRIIGEGRKHLAPDGFIALEVGIGQAQLVASLAKDSGFFEVSEIVKDYGNIERVVVLTER